MAAMVPSYLILGFGGLLLHPEEVFILIHRNLPASHVLNLHKGAPLDGQNHLVDGLLRALDLHGHRAIPLVSDPAGAAPGRSGVVGPVPESHALDPAVKFDMLSDDLTHTDLLPNSAKLLVKASR